MKESLYDTGYKDLYIVDRRASYTEDELKTLEKYIDRYHDSKIGGKGKKDTKYSGSKGLTLDENGYLVMKKQDGTVV